MLDDESTFGFNEVDATEILNDLGNGVVEHNEWHPIPENTTGLVLYTPTGGIAARSVATVASAMCTIVNRSGTTISVGSGATQYEVWNLSTTAVAENVYIVAEWTNIGLVAVWEDC